MLERMRRRGWTEEQIAEQILPYMPRADARAGGRDSISVPPRVSDAWLDQQLPALDREQLRLVVEELEQRGWPAAKVAVAVLPHLLPKLPPVDADAVVAGLAQLGMSEDEVARLRPRA